MKRLLPALGFLGFALAGFAGTASAQVSVTIGEPGFYGRIVIGDAPRPVLLYDEPIIIERGYDRRPPVYLRVPPGHAKHWDKHCSKYHACGEPVYFVDDDWYERQYVPHYRDRHGPPHREGYREERREERRDYDRGDRRDDRGRERGRGRGHDD